jgi:dynein heavy chain 1
LLLGKGWENHIEGQKLKADGDSFRLKLNTQDIYDDLACKVQQCNLGVTGHIFAIEGQRSQTGRGSVLKLKVNFLPAIITLSKEVGLIEFTDPDCVCVCVCVNEKGKQTETE